MLTTIKTEQLHNDWPTEQEMMKLAGEMADVDTSHYKRHTKVGDAIFKIINMLCKTDEQYYYAYKKYNHLIPTA